MSRTGAAVYLYCVVRSARRPSMARAGDGLPGGTKPSAHQASGQLWIVTSDVPLEVYGPSELESRLRDLDWVSGVALAHERIVEHFARAHQGAVIPAKLFTMFSTLEKTLDDVSGRHAEIERVMKRIAGCQEWGVRITRRPVMAARDEAPATSGSAFLLARKAARDAVAIARTEAIDAAQTAFAALARHARDATQRERRPEPGTNPPVLEAAFLVSTAARTRFKAEVRRQTSACSAAGVDLVLTGPWPAYNFIGTRP